MTEINFRKGRVESMIIFDSIPTKERSVEIYQWIDNEVRQGTPYAEILDICKQNYKADVARALPHLRGEKSITDEQIKSACNRGIK
jgi:hypothetical protein